MTATFPEEKSYESMIKDRDIKIHGLEQIKSKQELNLIQIQDELHTMRIKEREEAYWSRLNKQKQELQSVSAEKRIKELEQEIIDNSLYTSSSVMKLPQSIDKAYVTKIHSHLTKSLRIIGVLDSQITTVKASCDEIIKTLKAEISEMMEDRSKVELNLLNQLAALDNEKQVIVDQSRMRLESLQNEINQLKGLNEHNEVNDVDKPKTLDKNINTERRIESKNIGKGNHDNEEAQSRKTFRRDFKSVPPQTAFEIPLKKQLDSLTTENKTLNRTLQESGDKIMELETQKNEQERTICKLEVDLKTAKKFHAFECTEIIKKLEKDAEEAKETMARISEIQVSTNKSTQKLEPQLQFLKGAKNVKTHDLEGRDSMTSSFNNALLIQEQIQISLYLVELKLKNQLTAVIDGKVVPEFAKRTMLTRRDATKEKTRQLQSNAILMIRDIEESSKNQIRFLHTEQQDEMSRLRRDLAVSRSTIAELEGIVTKMKQDYIPTGITPKKDSKKGIIKRVGSERSVDSNVVDQLHNEVFKAVDRLKEKNGVIEQLTTSIEEHKLRENLLRKQMSRMNKKMTLMEGDDILSSLEKSAWGNR